MCTLPKMAGPAPAPVSPIHLCFAIEGILGDSIPGEGEFGRVYKGKRNGKLFAVKVLKPRQDEKSVRREASRLLRCGDMPM